MFTCQSVSSGGPAVVAPMRREQKLPLSWRKPAPASSKVNLALAKAESLSASVTKYLRLKSVFQQLIERGVRIGERNSFADTKVSEELNKQKVN